jgi:hypothetical protein
MQQRWTLMEANADAKRDDRKFGVAFDHNNATCVIAA